MKALLSRLLPKSLGGQLISLLLLALIVSQAVSLWMFHGERKVALIEVARDSVLNRTISMVRLLEETPEELHPHILDAASSRIAVFWIDDYPEVDDPGDDRAEERLTGLLQEQLGPDRTIHVDLSTDRLPPLRLRPPPPPRQTGAPRWHPPAPPNAEQGRPDRPRGPDHWKRMTKKINLAFSITLQDGSWFNVTTSYRPPPRAIYPLLVQLALMALSIVLIVAFMIRKLSQPLRKLAKAADRFGRGEDVSPLAEEGPQEVRAATTAFNEMQGRLTRFVSDRTRMLAAISHDLRTPITSLRLRAEFIDDDENREKIIETLDEMSQMTEATLAFARDEAAKEEPRQIDLGGLLESIAGDQVDMGHDVETSSDQRVVMTCRPVSLKRALRNLIENSVRYGGAARVQVTRTGAEAQVTIEDSGPGIPEDRLKDVFEPFVRLEESRSEETGGIGLGLAITRSIIHAHGGTVELANKPDGGLVATIRLPLAD